MELEYGSVVPTPGAWDPEHRAIFDFLRRLVELVATDLEPDRFAPDAALRRLNELVRMAHAYGRSWDYTRGVRACEARRATARVLELTAAKTLALLTYPVMPSFSTRLWQDLGLLDSVETHGWLSELTLIPGGTLLSPLARGYEAAPVA